MQNCLHSFYPVTEYNIKMKLQADSKIHLKISTRKVRVHHIHPRSHFDRIECFRDIFGGRKSLRKAGEHKFYISVNELHVLLDY